MSLVRNLGLVTLLVGCSPGDDTGVDDTYEYVAPASTCGEDMVWRQEDAELIQPPELEAAVEQWRKQVYVLDYRIRDFVENGVGHYDPRILHSNGTINSRMELDTGCSIALMDVSNLFVIEYHSELIGLECFVNEFAAVCYEGKLQESDNPEADYELVGDVINTLDLRRFTWNENDGWMEGSVERPFYDSDLWDSNFADVDAPYFLEADMNDFTSIEYADGREFRACWNQYNVISTRKWSFTHDNPIVCTVPNMLWKTEYCDWESK